MLNIKKEKVKRKNRKNREENITANTDEKKGRMTDEEK